MSKMLTLPLDQLIKIPAAIVIYAIVKIGTNRLGHRLEKIPPSNLLFAWLAEVGSDVRNLGKGLAVVTAIGIPLSAIVPSLAIVVFRVFFAYLIAMGAVGMIALLNTGERWAIEHLKPSLSQRDRQFALTMYPLIANLAKYAIYFFALIFICATWGFDLIPMLAGLGLVGLVVGIGAQDLISDLVAGIFIIFERLYYAESEIEILFIEGEGFSVKGIVDRITWRITYLRCEDGSTIAISNRTLTAVRVIKK